MKKPRYTKGQHLSQDEFLRRCGLVHGDKYDYSLTEYKGQKTKVKIICHKHGPFEQYASDHWNGGGCKKCHFESQRKWDISQDDFLRQYYLINGAIWCANKLDKTVHAVRGRAQVLKIAQKQGKWEYKILPRCRWKALEDRCNNKDFKLTLTPDFIETLYFLQEAKCALTGWPILFHSESRLNTASIDRIDSKLGYVVGNVQIVHKLVNWAKNDFAEEEFYKICYSVSEFRKTDLKKKALIWEEDIWNNTETPRVVFDTVLQ